MITRLTPNRFVVATAAVVTLLSCRPVQEEPAYDIAPVLINRDEITRAMRSVGAGVEAQVILLVRVDELGYVQDVRVSQGSGSIDLDNAAVWIGEQMRFEPARYNGEPVPALVSVPVTFDLVERVSYPPRLRNADVVARMIVNEYGDVRGRCSLRVHVGPEGWIRQTRAPAATNDEARSAAQRLIDEVTFWPGYRGDSPIAGWVTVVFEFAGPNSRIFIESSG
jgi:TonB family protein